MSLGSCCRLVVSRFHSTSASFNSIENNNDFLSEIEILNTKKWESITHHHHRSDRQSLAVGTIEIGSGKQLYIFFASFSVHTLPSERRDIGKAQRTISSERDEKWNDSRAVMPLHAEWLSKWWWLLTMNLWLHSSIDANEIEIFSTHLSIALYLALLELESRLSVRGWAKPNEKHSRRSPEKKRNFNKIIYRQRHDWALPKPNLLFNYSIFIEIKRTLFSSSSSYIWLGKQITTRNGENWHCDEANHFHHSNSIHRIHLSFSPVSCEFLKFRCLFYYIIIYDFPLISIKYFPHPRGFKSRRKSWNSWRLHIYSFLWLRTTCIVGLG